MFLEKLESLSEGKAPHEKLGQAMVKPVPCQDRVFKFKNRYLIYAVHPRPESKKLVFIFSGVDATAGTCRMSYFGMGNEINATVVHIMDHQGAHGTYMLRVAGDNQICNVVVALIRELQAEFGCAKNDTYFTGTSKGASIAILYALMTGGGHVIGGEPQIRIGDFIYAKGWEKGEMWRSMAYAITGRVNEGDREHINELFAGIVRQYGSRFIGSMNIAVGNTGYWENHLAYFSELVKEHKLDDKVTIHRYPFTDHDDVKTIYADMIHEYFSLEVKNV